MREDNGGMLRHSLHCFLMKLSVPSHSSVTQGFLSLYLNAIVVSWPSSLFCKSHNHHLTLFPCKVRQSSPTASTSRTSLSEKNLSGSLPQSKIGYSWKILLRLLAFGLFRTVSFLRRKRLRDDGYVDVKKSSDDQNNKLKKTRWIWNADINKFKFNTLNRSICNTKIFLVSTWP